MKKRYWAILVLLFLVGLDWYIRAPDARSRQLTGAIDAQAGASLKSYPYKFRVMKVEGGTAVMSTPRSFAVPAVRMLAVLHPGIKDVRWELDRDWLLAHHIDVPAK